MNRIMNISNIMKDLVPYSEEHACLNIFIILYKKIMEEDDEYYEYYEYYTKTRETSYRFSSTGFIESVTG